MRTYYIVIICRNFTFSQMTPKIRISIRDSTHKDEDNTTAKKNPSKPKTVPPQNHSLDTFVLPGSLLCTASLLNVSREYIGF